MRLPGVKDAWRPCNLFIQTQAGKWTIINNVRFAYGHDVIEHALLSGQAISYRFLKDEKGWRVFASTQYQEVKPITSRLAGAIGVDLNADHLAVTEVDHFG
ncbi:MAG: hypothetical protein A4E57_02646 [Syntrophorhabdaceae bacterium PtaU1.Bin034]|nr:MAG: hypothetical protein A4E57_02646 [Syntrophorhabdaceae bacterium PtaU1.Bin034]